MVFMIVMTGCAMFINLNKFYASANWLLFSIALATIFLEIWMIIESIVVLKNVYGKEAESTAPA